ncbi:hypothetical protein [Nocardioides sp. CFH 31398]|uniref:hypothetical protein n=1 Tax=Nocardioides sp. CFH 31398 TaxID=2919579 RepID=UPI001F052615|nr:hypothetical protein [Nocardioides sp. CFH 31398]MCH1868792.1 hypothetical protein [Nocardioides sp. CFH 31398]
MTPDDVRELARSAPYRWTELDLVHRSCGGEHLEVSLRHGVLTGRDVARGRDLHDTERPPSSFFRPVEPYPTNYLWCAMLDPDELSHDVRLTEISEGELFGRPVVSFVAHAEDDYDPVCTCCPLVFSEASERHEQPDGWTPAPGELPDGVEITLDREAGIVVSSRDRGGRLESWFTTEITRVVR